VANKDFGSSVLRARLRTIKTNKQLVYAGVRVGALSAGSFD